MDVLALLLALALVVGVSFWTYLRRETPVRGRLVLAALRGAALALLALLFWNPEVSLWGSGPGADAPTVLLDASASMAARAPSGETTWDEGVRRARELAGSDGRVLLFGSWQRIVPVGALDSLRPLDQESALTPALEQISALGGSDVTVVSDFRLEDPVRVAGALRRSGLGVRSVDVGAAVPGVGIVEVRGPRIVAAGDEGELEVLVGGESGEPAGSDTGESAGAGASAPDSADLELRRGGELLASIRVAVPSSGRTVRHVLPFTAPEEEGTHRLVVSVRATDDAFPDDDAYPHLLDVADEGAGIVLLSLRPNWEPRFLLPVLEQVIGVEGRGFIRLADGRWIPMGLQVETEQAWDDQGVRELAAGARVLVVQGLTGESPEWIREAARAAPRLVLLPGDESGYELLGLQVDLPRSGEWYVTSGIPASPLAGELAGITVEGLPPLTELRALTTGIPGEMEPLRARQGSQGIQEPVVALVEDEGRRGAALLASGYWRWAARDGAPRETYRRFWSAIASWLLEEAGAPTGPRVAPAARPAPRGVPVEWRSWGQVGDSLRVRVFAATGSDDGSLPDGPAPDGSVPAGSDPDGPVTDTTVTDTMVMDTTVVRTGATFRTSALPPGSYRYEVSSAELPAEGVSGPLEVTAYSGDFLRPRMDPPGAAGGGEGGSGGAGRPLRTHPAPYLAILLLLSAEWIGRRRQGLR